ncbi:MFS transporter [Alkalihalobacillus oceani]|uniref:MFS transporter n=1 Tax=Halalkalibacter oceani TaxID=1653776 RepID=UPI00203EDC0B|nr:MFS transporter [Halalkalibacter oceani]MCM3759629.1 MFS transporter [Halalkalibacter oceani]
MGKIVWPGVAMIAVTYALARFSFGLYLPDISASLQLKESTAGIAASAAFASYSLALLTAPFLTRMVGAFRLVQAAGLTVIVGMSGIALAQGLSLLVLSTFVAGLGSGWASPALSQIATNSLKEAEKDRANIWINSGSGFGLLVTGPVALLFTEYWRLAYLLFVMIALAVFLWNSLSLPVRQEKAGNWEWKVSWRSISKAKGLLSASLVIGLSSAVFWAFSRSYLTVVHQMTTRESITFWMVMGAAGIIGGLAGNIIRKFGLDVIYRVVLVLMLLAIGLITIPAVWSVYASALLFGSAYIALTGALIVWATRLFPAVPSIGVSLSFLALGLGQSLGSLAGGALIASTSYPFVFLMFAAIGTAGLFIAIKR